MTTRDPAGGRPADPKADGLASCYAATCWPRGLMRAVSPWT